MTAQRDALKTILRVRPIRLRRSSLCLTAKVGWLGLGRDILLLLAFGALAAGLATGAVEIRDVPTIAIGLMYAAVAIVAWRLYRLGRTVVWLCTGRPMLVIDASGVQVPEYPRRVIPWQYIDKVTKVVRYTAPDNQEHPIMTALVRWPYNVFAVELKDSVKELGIERRSTLLEPDFEIVPLHLSVSSQRVEAELARWLNA